MRALRERPPLRLVDPAPNVDVDLWQELRVEATQVEHWKAIGFGPFEAAIAQGDGFTPFMAVHHRHQLQRIARSWVRRGLGTAEALRWHRAGFTAKETKRWRSSGFEVETARARRAGYTTRPDRDHGSSARVGYEENESKEE
ncbi:MAG: hypothetical protein ACRDV4_05750 [Acidimicrobiales bacterium]